MKNTKKGFIVPLLVAIIAVLVIGGGVYFYYSSSQHDGVCDPCYPPEQEGSLNTEQQTVTEQATTSPVVVKSAKLNFSFQEIPLSKTDTFDSMGAPYETRLLQMDWVSSDTLKIVLAVGVNCNNKVDSGNYSIKGDNITLTYKESGSGMANCNSNHKLQYTLQNLPKNKYTIYALSGEGTIDPVSLFVPKVSEVSLPGVTSGSLIASPTIGSAPLQVTFTTSGKDNAFTSFKFGDGQMFSVGAPSTLNNFSCNAAGSNSVCRGTHTYSAPGTYPATLYDAQGNILDAINVIVTSPASISANVWAFITTDKSVNPFGDHYFIILMKDINTGKTNGINIKVVYDNNTYFVDRLGDANGSNDKAGDFNVWLNGLKNCYAANLQCPGSNVFQVVGHYTESSTIQADKIIHTIQ